MKGDFSRITFRPGQHYSGVLLQQGRVAVDADFNEQTEIERARLRTLARDVIGPCGGPSGGAGFALRAADDGTLLVSAGRYYVDGLLVENEAEAAIEVDAQPGQHIVYLDVWEREVTAVDDPDLLDPALGGPDTSVRIQIVWQVRLQVAGESAPTEPELPCLEVRTADGYRGTENALYRVEIHSADDSGRAIFKWSRDNGSVVLPVLEVERDVLTLGSVDRLEMGQWLELTDETTDLDGRTGQLVEIVEVGRDKSTVRVLGTVEPLAGRPKARRWEGIAAVQADSDRWQPLDDGIEVLFSGAGYQSGDYWTFPARPSIGGVEWPGNAQPAGRVEHHRCPIASIKRSGKGNWRAVEDRRRLFAPLAR